MTAAPTSPTTSPAPTSPAPTSPAPTSPAPTSPSTHTPNHRAVTYNPATYTITIHDQSLRVDTVFQSLVRREAFDEATIEHTIAAFYANLRYVPVYVYAAPVSPTSPTTATTPTAPTPAATTPAATTPNDNPTYHPLMHVVVESNRLSIVSQETFHHAIVAYLTAAGYTVTVQQ